MSKILIIEDEASIRRVLVKILTEENTHYEVFEAEDGLIGYWSFNEGEGDTVYDLSGNGNHGTINGASYSTDVPDSNCE